MHYYRYRPYGELTIKEFMYDEIYFASTVECNDPFDGKVYAIFEADSEKWKRIIKLAWREFDLANKSRLEEQLAGYLSKKSPMSFDAALRIDYVAILNSLSTSLDPLIAYALGKRVNEFLDLYKPENRYFVSFSKVNNNPLMWSHYASMHRGHCLIFKAIDGCLQQCPKRKKKSISRKTETGIAPSMSYALPDKFPFQDVIYKDDITSIDAFSYFPQYVFGRELREQERLELVSNQEQQYLVKQSCWEYEQESRIILPTPDAWLFGEHIDYSKQERLFYYQPTQLVGIIIGARMDIEQKRRFRELIQSRMDRIAENNSETNIVFDFVLFQAKLPDNRREVIIEPEEIFTLTDTIRKTDSSFEKHLHKWQEGWAIEFDGSRATQKKFE